MTARTLFVLLLTAGVATAQEPPPTPTTPPTDPAPAAVTPTPTDPPTTMPPAPTTPAPATTPAVPATTAPPMTTTPGIVQSGYTTPMMTYPYQPGQIVQMGYSQPGTVYGSGMSSGYAYPGTVYAPGYTGVAYPTYGYTSRGGYPSMGYAYPSFANGYANSNFYGTPGGGRRWFRR